MVDGNTTYILRTRKSFVFRVGAGPGLGRASLELRRPGRLKSGGANCIRSECKRRQQFQKGLGVVVVILVRVVVEVLRTAVYQVHR